MLLKNINKYIQVLIVSFTVLLLNLPVNAELNPIGSNLFNGKFTSQPVTGINPSYVIMPGDRIALSIWGIPHTVEGAVFPVDIQGNIFLPDIGPVRVGGVANSSLNSVVSAQVRRVYTGNVEVYTNLISAQPVGIFVTGNVNNPGQYAGTHSDSVLYYLDAAGGIDEAGSFRNIKIVRENKVIEQIDLYDFIFKGKIKTPQLKDGDKVLVGVKGLSLAVTGEVKTPGLYEYNDNVSGKNSLEFIKLGSSANKVSLSGIRNESPVHKYLDLNQFKAESLSDGDRLHFINDMYSNTLFVNVSGETSSAKRFTVEKGAKLSDVVAKLSINDKIARKDSIYLLRKSLARQQKLALNDALARLEKNAYLVDSYTDAGAAIKLKEAQLLNQYVEKAKHFQPEGRLVVTDNGKIRDVLLEEDDVIVVPRKTNVIAVSGEVNMPSSFLYSKGKKANYYIKQAAGISANGDKRNVIVIRANGQLLDARRTILRPGDHLIVMPEVKTKGLQVIKDITQVIYQLAASTHYIYKK